ncbi:lipoprotein [Ramlibacter sp. H39-3-26]|uniref:LPS translocon maturation chaperone LptM n=1 Tax=Curvibacter soli TaxID=3031331 RepID=UPI0023D97E47|nr:lipoprotein [Ramlibacter sp. H39-3-26]MDF1483757.1 lipoprotein [Ramlibacter sp. H39-3-26]
MLNVRQILCRGLVLAASTVALGGCGQKGPLYLPPPPPAVPPAHAPATPATTSPQATPPRPSSNTAP